MKGLARQTPNWGCMTSEGHEGRLYRYAIRKPLTPRRAGRAIAFATSIVTVICGLLIWLLDSRDFDNFGVALWWAVQTVTTVGYGDEVPTHAAGRVIAAVLMLVGIGFLTVVTASITAAFIETVRRRTGDPAQERLEAKLDEINERLRKLESG